MSDKSIFMAGFLVLVLLYGAGFWLWQRRQPKGPRPRTPPLAVKLMVALAVIVMCAPLLVLVYFALKAHGL
jgi:uncharacterized membrane protein YidH (DUF202 family)